MSDKHDSKKKQMRTKAKNSMSMGSHGRMHDHPTMEREIGELAGDVQEDLVNIRNAGMTNHKH